MTLTWLPTSVGRSGNARSSIGGSGLVLAAGLALALALIIPGGVELKIEPPGKRADRRCWSLPLGAWRTVHPALLSTRWKNSAHLGRAQRRQPGAHLHRGGTLSAKIGAGMGYLPGRGRLVEKGALRSSGRHPRAPPATSFSASARPGVDHTIIWRGSQDQPLRRWPPGRAVRFHRRTLCLGESLFSENSCPHRRIPARWSCPECRRQERKEIFPLQAGVE